MAGLEKQAARLEERVSRGAQFLDTVAAKRGTPSALYGELPRRLPRAEKISAAEVGWPELQSLTADIEAADYPMDALPEIIRKAVEQVADEVQAPGSLIACSALSVVSVAAQGLFDVLRAPHLRSSINLFLLVIADSGERKSASDKRLTDALQLFEREALVRARPELERHRADIRAWEAKREGVLQKIKQAARTNTSTDALEVKLRELEGAQPKAPQVPRLVYADVTPEGLTYGLSKNWPSASILSNEAGIFFGSHGMSGESVMRNVAQLNTLWDGGKISVDRRSTESYVVDGARLTMGLMVQEQTLRGFFERNLTLARGSGFLARFLIAVPDSKMGTRLYKEPDPSATGVANFNRRIAELLKAPLPVDANGYLCPKPLRLSTAAKALWVTYYNLTEQQLGVGGELHEVRDIASKNAENAARIAGLLHVFSDKHGDINEDIMERACRIAAWHLNESRRFFAKIELAQDISDAVRLSQWLRHWCQSRQITAVKRSEVQRRIQNDLRNKYRLNAAIELLIQQGHIRRLPGPNQSMIELRPELRLWPEAR